MQIKIRNIETNYRFCKTMCPQYMNENYKTSNQDNTVTRNFSLKLFQPLRTKTLTQKCLSCLGPISLEWFTRLC